MPTDSEGTDKVIEDARALISAYREELLVAIAETVSDGKERGCHIWVNKGMAGHTSIQLGETCQIELKLKELPLVSKELQLISFHTHNGGNDTPSSRDIQTALSLGEALMCIGCVKDNRPHITCWKISVEKLFEVVRVIQKK